MLLNRASTANCSCTASSRPVRPSAAASGFISRSFSRVPTSPARQGAARQGSDRSLRVATRAGGPGTFGSDTDNDFLFVGKVAAISVSAAAAIKYGSLILDPPFQPNAALALFLVLGPPLAYSAMLLTSGGSSKQ